MTTPLRGARGPQYRILGDESQVLELTLAPGESVLMEPETFLGSMGGVNGLELSWGRRMLTPVLRAMSGEAALLDEVVCGDIPGVVLCGGEKQGHIVPWRVRPGHSVICKKGAFLAGIGQLELAIAIAPIRAGLFGNQGLVYQQIKGDGMVFLQAQGAGIERMLGPAGLLRISTGNILAFDDTVGMNIKFAGSMWSMLYGGGGLFMASLEGPGRVAIQSHDMRPINKWRIPTPRTRADGPHAR